MHIRVSCVYGSTIISCIISSCQKTDPIKQYYYHFMTKQNFCRNLISENDSLAHHLNIIVENIAANTVAATFGFFFFSTLLAVGNY